MDMDDNVPDLRRWNDLRACRNGRRLAVFTVQTGYSARAGEEETKQGEKRFLIPSESAHPSFIKKKKKIYKATLVDRTNEDTWVCLLL